MVFMMTLKTSRKHLWQLMYIWDNTWICKFSGLFQNDKFHPGWRYSHLGVFLVIIVINLMCQWHTWWLDIVVWISWGFRDSKLIRLHLYKQKQHGPHEWNHILLILLTSTESPHFKLIVYCNYFMYTTINSKYNQNETITLSCN